MNKFFSNIFSSKNKYIVITVLVGIIVFWSQIAKVLTFIRGRLSSKVLEKSTLEKVAQGSGGSPDYVAQSIRVEFCKGVASSIYALLHEKPLGFLPIGWFGSTENEAGIVRELNSLKTANEARFVSTYYAEKYSARLKGLLYKYLDSVDLLAIRPDIKNNLS